MALYTKFKSTFYYDLHQQNTGLSTEKKEALHKLSNNDSIIICKPDKSNDVVILNKQDYIKKMEKNYRTKRNLKKLAATTTFQI